MEEQIKFDNNSNLCICTLPESIEMDENLFKKFWDIHPSRKKIEMYGKTIEIYRYSLQFNINSNPHKNLIWFNDYIEQLYCFISAKYNIDFDTVYINWYSDGKASIAKHRDGECKEKTSVIGFNFGAQRDMRFGKFKNKFSKEIDKSFETKKFIMKHNTMYSMITINDNYNGFQEMYWHEVPKVSKVIPHEFAGTKRISITFRILK